MIQDRLASWARVDAEPNANATARSVTMKERASLMLSPCTEIATVLRFPVAAAQFARPAGSTSAAACCTIDFGAGERLDFQLCLLRVGAKFRVIKRSRERIPQCREPVGRYAGRGGERAA